MFKKLLTLDEAKQAIYGHFNPKPLGVEEIPLLEAHGRVLEEDITAALNIPPFDRSTVDGYAVKADDTSEAEEDSPVKLRVCGTVTVGELSTTVVSRGEAAEIATGAPMPKGSDAVIMAEYTHRKGDHVHVFSAAVKDENVMKVGSDIKKGEPVLRRGKILDARDIGVLAALGASRARVHVAPRVAVLSTGAEVMEPGITLPAGKIYDINAYSLSAGVIESGGNPIYLGVFPDDKVQLKKALKRALNMAHLVVTSGGVSVGPKDLMPETVDSLGKPGVIVCGIAIKPGKPTTVAVVDEKLVFSLPGHPTSALLVFHLLVQPIINGMAGRKPAKSFEVKALAGMRIFSAKGRRTFVMVRLRRQESNRLVAEPVETGLSGAITTLAKADGFVEMSEDQQFIDAEEEVTVHVFKSLEEQDVLT
jgi:molybdenum cofactor synthesis domain-containing protein